MLIAGNWKMFKGPAETLEFFDRFEAPDGVEVVICPPFVSLEAAVGEEWTIYAQNVHWASEGAFTGEISAGMLVELGVQGAIVGHSAGRRSIRSPSPRSAAPQSRERPARDARDPRRLGDRAGRSRERRRAGADSGVRRSLGTVRAHAACRVR